MTTPDPREHRIGRFRFLLPAAFAVTGRSQSIYRVDASTVALAAPGSPANAEAWWTTKLAALRRGRRPTGVADIVIRPLALPSPDLHGVLHYAGPDTDELQTVLVTKAYPDHLVQLSRQTEVDGVPEIEKMVASVIGSYVPGGREGFDIGHGMLTSVPGVNEQARIALRHAGLPGVELDLDTRTVRTPEGDPMAGVDQDKQRLAAAGQTLVVLRNQRRSVAGLPGSEVRLQIRKTGAPSEGLLRFSWHFPGVAALPTAPAIMAVASAPLREQAALEAAWEAFLESLQLLPLAVRR